MNKNDLWEALGDLDDNDLAQVLIQVFTAYEQAESTLQPGEEHVSQVFFSRLSTALSHVQSCNVNRR